MSWKILFSPFVAIWNYFKVTWEGDDGKPSYRRASQFVLIFLTAYMVLTKSTQNSWGFWTFLVLVLGFLLLAAVINADQILKGIYGLGNFSSTVTKEIESDPNKTTVTTTVESKVPVAENPE